MAISALQALERPLPLVSVVLPTYNEALNIPVIIPKIMRVLRRHRIEAEVIVVDDASPDGTAEIARSLSSIWPVRVCARYGERGLASAVIEGFRQARGQVCVVMDADLSHPPDSLPALIKPILTNDCDIVVGSRYVCDGGMDSWPWFRHFFSRTAGLLARGVTSLRDPTSGFMAVRRSLIFGASLDPVGWKIVLETVVKAQGRVREIPIVFRDRQAGASKLGLRAQAQYVEHLLRLYGYRFPALKRLTKLFSLAVPSVVVDTMVLVLLVQRFNVDLFLAASAAFSTSFFARHFGNRTSISRSVVLEQAFRGPFPRLAISISGLVLRLIVMIVLVNNAGMREFPGYVIASLMGIASATLFTFLLFRFFFLSEAGNRGTR